LAEVLFDGIQAETEYGRNFEDFSIHDEYPETGSLVFPCFVILREPSGTTDYLFGGNQIRTLNLIVEIAFKEKTGFVAREHDFLSTEKLVMWYEERMNELVKVLESRFEDIVPIVELYTTSERHFPQEKNQELYGLTYTIIITYVV